MGNVVDLPIDVTIGGVFTKVGRWQVGANGMLFSTTPRCIAGLVRTQVEGVAGALPAVPAVRVRERSGALLTQMQQAYGRCLRRTIIRCWAAMDPEEPYER